MKKVLAHCGTMYPGTETDEELEFEDDATEEEIESCVREWAIDNIGFEYDYEIVDGDEDDEEYEEDE